MPFELPPPPAPDPENTSWSADNSPSDISGVPADYLPNSSVGHSEVCPDITAPDDYGSTDSSSEVDDVGPSGGNEQVVDITSPAGRGNIEEAWKLSVESFERQMATPDGAEVKAFLDSATQQDGRQAEIPLEEQKAAGAIVSDAAASFISGDLKGEAIPGRSKTERRVEAGPDGGLFKVTALWFHEAIARATNTKFLVGIREVPATDPANGRAYRVEVGMDSIARRTDVQVQTRMKPENETPVLRRRPIGADEARRLVSMVLRRPEES